MKRANALGDLAERIDTSVVALVALVAAPLAAFWSVVATHQRSLWIYPYNVRQFYPYYQKLASAIHHGYVPLWDANVNSGNSFAGEIQPGIFYPLNLIAVALFGTPDGISTGALDGFLVVHFFLASLGMYLFARALGVSPLAAAFSGIVFSYVGPHANRAMAQAPIFLTYSLLPFAPYFALQFAKTHRLGFAVAAGVAIGIQMLAGHFAAPFFTGLICLAVIFDAKFSVRRNFAATVLLGAGALAVASPQLIFGLLHFLNSYRIVGKGEPQLATAHIPLSAINDLSLKPSGLLTFFDPIHFFGGLDANEIYVGLVPIAIVVLGATNAVVRARILSSLSQLRLLYVLAALSLVLAVGTATPIGRVWYSLPVLSSIVRESGRYVLIFQFAIAVFCGTVLDGLRGDERLGAWRRLGEYPFRDMSVALLAIFGLYLAYVFRDIPHIRPAFFVVSLAIVAFFALRPRLATIALVALGSYEAIASAATIAQPVALASYAPNAYRESPVFRVPEACYPTCRTFFDVGYAVPRNVGDVLKLQTTGGYTALIDRDYYDFVFRGDPAYDALNVRYIIATHPMQLPLVERDEQRGFYLYERPTAFPRVYSLRSVLARNPTVNDVTFGVVAYNDVDETFSVKVDRPEVVVFAEQYYPGWSVRIDGVPATLYVADIHLGPPVLRAVRLKAGTHTVQFKYAGL